MYNREVLKVSPRLMEMFLNYTWQGNVRELENNVKRLIILGNEAQLIAEFQRKRENGQYGAIPDDAPAADRAAAPRTRTAGRASSQASTAGEDGNGGGGHDAPNLSGKATLKEVSKIAQRIAEKELIEKVLGQTRWNRRKAAQILDISYKALLYKIKDCGLNME
jgi:two-component system response regulator AtoC